MNLNDGIEFYFKPYEEEKQKVVNINDFREEHIQSYEKAISNEYSLREKIAQIDSFFKVNLFNFAPKIIFPNKINDTNEYIQEVLNIVIEMIKKMNSEKILKDSVLQKMEAVLKNENDLEKKISQLQTEVAKKDKIILSLQGALKLSNEKIEKEKKASMSDVSEVKQENKKYQSKIQMLKNEIRKKELEFEKIKSKFQLMISKNNSTVPIKNSFDVVEKLPKEKECEDQSVSISLVGVNKKIISLLKILNRCVSDTYDSFKDMQDKKRFIEIREESFNNSLINEKKFCVIEQSLMSNVELVNKKLLKYKAKNGIARSKSNWFEINKKISIDNKNIINNINNED